MKRYHRILIAAGAALIAVSLACAWTGEDKDRTERQVFVPKANAAHDEEDPAPKKAAASENRAVSLEDGLMIGTAEKAEKAPGKEPEKPASKAQEIKTEAAPKAGSAEIKAPKKPSPPAEKQAEAEAPSEEFSCAHEWKADQTPATCTKDGHTDYVCTRCGEKRSETIPSPGHIWKETSETVHHEEMTEPVTVTDSPAWTETAEEPVYELHEVCSACGMILDGMDEDALWDHLEKHGLAGEAFGFFTGDIQVGTRTVTIEHPAVTHTETKVISPAWDEEITDAMCAVCGETK